MSRSNPGVSAMRSASRRRAAHSGTIGDSATCFVNSASARSSTVQKSSTVTGELISRLSRARGALRLLSDELVVAGGGAHSCSAVSRLIRVSDPSAAKTPNLLAGAAYREVGSEMRMQMLDAALLAWARGT